MFCTMVEGFSLTNIHLGQILNLYNRAEGAVLANCLCYTSSYIGAISPEGVMPGGERRRQILLRGAAKASKQGRNSYKTIFLPASALSTPQQAFGGS